MIATPLKEITAQVVVEALTIMRGLAEDAEPPPGWKLVPIEPTDAMWDAGYDLDYCSAPGKVWADMMAVIPSPQAAQTALKSESSAQAAQALARLPGEGKTIEALAPFDVNAGDSNSVVSQNQRNVDVKTEEQEREAFEAEFDQLCKDYSIYGLIEARLCKVFFEAGRTGSKP